MPILVFRFKYMYMAQGSTPLRHVTLVTLRCKPEKRPRAYSRAGLGLLSPTHPDRYEYRLKILGLGWLPLALPRPFPFLQILPTLVVCVV